MPEIKKPRLISSLGFLATLARDLEVHSEARHNLTWTNQLIASCANTKDIGKPCIDTSFISKVFTNQLNAPIFPLWAQANH